MKKPTLLIILSTISTLLYSELAFGHVKWFSSYKENMTPVSIDMLGNSQNLMFLVLALVAIFITRFTSNSLTGFFTNGLTLIKNIVIRDSLRNYLQISLFITVLLCWHYDVVLTPELPTTNTLITIIQFSIILTGFVPALRKLLPVGIVLLFMSGIYQAGLFHMMDYMYVLAVAWFIWVTQNNTSEHTFKRAMYVLYFATGFSLCWVGIEKLIYPHWVEDVLSQQPVLALGMPYSFFIRGAAFVEFTIGFFFILQLWPRICAIALSILMVFTTFIFGVTEIIGHLLLHTILIVFIYLGSIRDDVLVLNNRPLVISLMSSSLYIASFVALTSIYYFLADSLVT